MQVLLLYSPVNSKEYDKVMQDKSAREYFYLDEIWNKRGIKQRFSEVIWILEWIILNNFFFFNFENHISIRSCRGAECYSCAKCLW